MKGTDYKKIGLADFAKSENYYQRQITRWSQQYEKAKTKQIESMENLMKWLPANIPQTDEGELLCNVLGY